MINIGARIKKRRKELQLTQTDIYNKCGIASGALSQIENGNRTPSVITFYKLSQILNCTMEWLVTGESSKTKNIPTLNLGEMEHKLINQFNQLSEDDREDILVMVQLKYNRQIKLKEKSQQLSHSENNQLTSETA